MSIEDNKKKVAAFLEGVAVNAMDLLHPDLTFFVAGDMEGCGMLDAAGLARLHARLTRDAAGPFIIKPTHMVGEGNFVSVEAVGNLLLTNGRIYNNHYHLIFEFKDGKIKNVREYSDTDHLRRIFDLKGEPEKAISRT